MLTRSSKNYGTIENCTATGNASGEKAGGFVGRDYEGTITNCTATGTAHSAYSTAGGFVGKNKKGTITNCTAKGTAKGWYFAGGFVGKNSGIIKESSSTGEAKGNTAGGFAGVNKAEIKGCKAEGKATAKTESEIALAGGFVGENENGTITDCEATGVADSRSKSGQAKAGGFAGTNKASIMNSKASGSVYLSSGKYHTDNGCGGFVGKNDKGGKIDSCYAECIVETTNHNKGGGFVGEAKNKSEIYNSSCKTKRVTKNIITKKEKTKKSRFLL